MTWTWRTLFWRLGSAPRYKRTFAIFKYPLRLASNNEVHPLSWMKLLTTWALTIILNIIITFAASFGSAPLSRSNSTISKLPFSDAHIKADHPCCSWKCDLTYKEYYDIVSLCVRLYLRTLLDSLAWIADCKVSTPFSCSSIYLTVWTSSRLVAPIISYIWQVHFNNNIISWLLSVQKRTDVKIWTAWNIFPKMTCLNPSSASCGLYTNITTVYIIWSISEKGN